MKWSILYRSRLASCNYGCGYCPFQKAAASREELLRDATGLRRFVDWVETRKRDTIGIFFTPWGEVLVHRHYQQAMSRLSHMPHVRRVVAQTNLSCGLDWIDSCDKRCLALWTTFHPTQVRRSRFVARCVQLSQSKVRYSVGVVGVRESFGEIAALRAELPREVYLWVNAYKQEPDYYSSQEIELLTGTDPLFAYNNKVYSSRGRRCRAGESVVAVDEEGTLRRCHFIEQPLGNIYTEGFEASLGERPCTNQTCHCHIGYVHLDDLKLAAVFGSGVLERIPQQSIWRADV